MHQGRHRRDQRKVCWTLKRLYLELTPVPGRAPKKSDAVRPLRGLKLPALSFWEFLRMTPEAMRKQLSATDDVP